MINKIYDSSHHLVAVDCIIFGYENEQLKLLLFQRDVSPAKGEWSLLGGWVKQNETIEQAASRVLERTTGLTEIYLEQIHVFSDPDRDPGGRVISIALNALIDINKQNKKLIEDFGARWWSIRDLPPLVFDHKKMFEYALYALRSRANKEIIGSKLLPELFTIVQLRDLYNAIFQMEFDAGNFRKKILSLKMLEKTDFKNAEDSRKGSYYYRFKDKAKLNSSTNLFTISLPIDL